MPAKTQKNRSPCMLLVGMQICLAITENSMELLLLQRTKNEGTMCLALHQINKIQISKRYLCSIHCYSIHISQVWDQPNVPWWIKICYMDMPHTEVCYALEEMFVTTNESGKHCVYWKKLGIERLTLGRSPSNVDLKKPSSYTLSSRIITIGRAWRIIWGWKLFHQMVYFQNILCNYIAWLVYFILVLGNDFEINC